MKFCSSVLELHLPQNFCHAHTDIQTDRHFLKIFRSCSGHPKTWKSIKNRKSKICTKPILSSTYIEESKNCMELRVQMLHGMKLIGLHSQFLLCNVPNAFLSKCNFMLAWWSKLELCTNAISRLITFYRRAWLTSSFSITQATTFLTFPKTRMNCFFRLRLQPIFCTKLPLNYRNKFTFR